MTRSRTGFDQSRTKATFPKVPCLTLDPDRRLPHPAPDDGNSKQQTARAWMKGMRAAGILTFTAGMVSLTMLTPLLTSLIRAGRHEEIPRLGIPNCPAHRTHAPMASTSLARAQIPGYKQRERIQVPSTPAASHRSPVRGEAPVRVWPCLSGAGHVTRRRRQPTAAGIAGRRRA
jgi:hypothetical protein